MSEHLKTCKPKTLPRELWSIAATRAVSINPQNHSPVYRLARVIPGYKPTAEHIAVLTNRYWGPRGVRLTVGFLENVRADLQARILGHMNIWGTRCDVQFALSRAEPQIRITLEGDGYWSYVGTDNLHIARNEPTMSLERFTMSTPESEFHRVVRHETGHVLGCPHEHMRAELIARIDPEKAIAYFRDNYGWNEEMVREQVLTPIEEGSLMGTPHPDPHSIMCYQIPGDVTHDGQPIPGGPDIDELDYRFMASIYPGSEHAVSCGAETPASQDAAAQLRDDNDVLRRALSIYARAA